MFDGEDWKMYDTKTTNTPSDKILSITIDKDNKKYIESHKNRPTANKKS